MTLITLTRPAALRLVAESTFRPFRASDWRGLGGVESDRPLICDDRPDFLIVIDGERAVFILAGSDLEQTFRLEIELHPKQEICQ